MSANLLSADIGIIELSHDHIDYGERGVCAKCPIAICLSQHFEMPVRSLYSHSTVGSQLYTHTPELQQWIISFDVKRTVHPIMLVINYGEHTIGIYG